MKLPWFGKFLQKIHLKLQWNQCTNDGYGEEKTQIFSLDRRSREEFQPAEEEDHEATNSGFSRFQQDIPG